MSINVNACDNPIAEPTKIKQIAKEVSDAGARPLLLPRARDLSLSDCPSLASSLASLLLAMALVPVADGAELVPMATDGEPAQARADAAPMTTDGETAQAGADAAPVPGAEAQAGVTATTVTFDVYMPQFEPHVFPPLQGGGAEGFEDIGLVERRPRQDGEREKRGVLCAAGCGAQ